MYLDTSYVLKFYLNEPDSHKVRALVQQSRFVQSSMLAFPEFHGGIHRKYREGQLTLDQAQEIVQRFSAHIDQGLWTLLPSTGPILRQTGALIMSAPPGIFIRTADAIHLTTAHQLGEAEVWTNDRHMLAAAPHFGLKGRSV